MTNEEPLKLEDIVRSEAEITLFDLEGQPVECHLMPVTLEDEAWMNKKFGIVNLHDIFQKQNWEQFCQIVYRLLREKDSFGAIRIKTRDDDGVQQEVLLTGPQRVMRGIRSPHQRAKIMEGLLATFGFSRPILDKISKLDPEKLKKKVEELQKSATGSPVGEKSTTNSPQLTDSASEKSVG